MNSPLNSVQSGAWRQGKVPPPIRGELTSHSGGQRTARMVIRQRVASGPHFFTYHEDSHMSGNELDAERLLEERCERVGGCLLWRGHLQSNGAPILYLSGKRRFNPRMLIFTQLFGRSPKGGSVVLLCGNVACLEPSHMRERSGKGPDACPSDDSSRRPFKDYSVAEIMAMRSMGSHGVLWGKAIAEKDLKMARSDAALAPLRNHFMQLTWGHGSGHHAGG